MKPKSSKQSIGKLTYQHALTQNEATEKFVASMPQPTDHLKDFLFVMSKIMGGASRSFTLDDVLRDCVGNLELPHATAKDLFLNHWLPMMERFGRIDSIVGAYGFPTYIIL